MGQAIVGFIFNLLAQLASVILAPIFLVVSLVIPDFSSFLESMNLYIGYGLTYINFFIDLLMIPRTPLLIVVTMWLGIFTFNISLKAYAFVLAVYKTLKP